MKDKSIAFIKDRLIYVGLSDMLSAYDDWENISLVIPMIAPDGTEVNTPIF
jgi:hypothetical protein